MELHPATVHFPVALLITSGISWIIYFITRNAEFKTVAFWLHTFGLIGVGLAILTGNLEIPVRISEAGRDVLSTHEILGYVIAWLYLILWLWHYFRKSSMSNKEAAAFASIFVISLALVVWTAFLGGKLVYEFGAGIDH